jgi:hypothetical protein
MALSKSTAQHPSLLYGSSLRDVSGYCFSLDFVDDFFAFLAPLNSPHFLCIAENYEITIG